MRSLQLSAWLSIAGAMACHSNVLEEGSDAVNLSTGGIAGATGTTRLNVGGTGGRLGSTTGGKFQQNTELAGAAGRYVSGTAGRSDSGEDTVPARAGTAAQVQTTGAGGNATNEPTVGGASGSGTSGTEAAGGSNSAGASGSGTSGTEAAGGSSSPGAVASAGTAGSGAVQTDAACSTRKPDEAHGLFVDGATGTDVNACGQTKNPCKSINFALARVGGPVQFIYVARGTYVEAITLQPGLSIDGGWTVVNQVWTPDCSNAASSGVVLRGPEVAVKMPNTAAGSAITVFAEFAATNTAVARLSNLTVESKVQAALGESLYGIFARGTGTHLELQDVRVIANNGGSGERGRAGDTGANGSTAGCLPAGTGDNGRDNLNAGTDAATSGTFDEQGYHPVDGKQGPVGTEPGQNSPLPPMPACKTDCTSCPTIRPGSSYPTSNLCSGTGAKPTTLPTVVDTCSQQGRPGCGGRPGGGGLGGKGGGGSVALFAWDARVTFTNGLLKPASGGNGGEGGPGGLGGLGVVGKPGDPPKNACSRCSFSCNGGPPSDGCTCLLTDVNNYNEVGIAGEKGGNGSRGGKGGGGSGGHAYAVYVNITAKDLLALSANTELITGTPGTGFGSAASGYGDKVFSGK